MTLELIVCPDCRGAYYGKWARAFVHGDPLYLDESGEWATYCLYRRTPVTFEATPVLAEEPCPSCDEAAS